MKKSNSVYVILIAFTAAIGGLLLGFDGSVISGASPFYKSVFGLKDGSFLFGLTVSALIWGCIFGNFFAGPVSDLIGRKPTLLVAAVLFVVSSLMAALAPRVALFIIGRMLAGFGVGFAILVAPVYIAEIAPPKNRGWLVSFNQLLIVIGISSAYFSNYFILNLLDNPITNWRWMLGIEVFPSALYFLLILLIPESPRWLLMKNQTEKAKGILLKIGGSEHAEIEYDKIVKSLAQQTALRKKEQAKELFSKKMRLILIIGFGLAIFQQVSGINSVLYYAPMIFESAGSGRDAAFIQAIAIGLVFMVTTIISMLVIDKLGRKPLLYIGVTIMAISLLITGLTFRNINSIIVLISILGFIAGFSISLGPVMWAMFSEIFPNRLRGLAISVVGTANSFTSFLVATFFPVQLKIFDSSNTFFIYSGCMFLCLLFIWKFVVETKGKSLEDLEKVLIKKD